MSGKVKRKKGSKKYCDSKVPCDCTNDIICHAKPIRLEEKPLLVFCGQGGQAQFSSLDDPAVNIGSVTVDARGLRRPKVKIKFSSIVNLTGPDLENPQAALTFRLFRVCNEGAAIPLNSWVYEAFNINDVEVLMRFNTSFSFIFCDRTNNGRLCDYFVEVSLGNLSDATISVDNVQIQALAQ